MPTGRKGKLAEDPRGAPDSETTPALDGRRARGQRSRERILEGLAQVLEDPDLGAVSPEVIVARAGVSMSTLFRHFGDTEGVAEAMRGRLMARIAPIVARPFVGAPRARLADLVERRAQIFEIIGPFRRAAQRGLQSGRGHDAQDERRLTAQVDTALAPELAACDPDVVELVQALLSFDTWSRLRTVQGLEAERAARIVEEAAARLLGLD